MTAPFGTAIREWWEQERKSKHEHGGLLIGGKMDSWEHGQSLMITDLIAVENKSKTPKRAYLLKKKSAIKALADDGRGYTLDDVIGVLHTHPKGSPEGQDPSWEDVDNIKPEHLGVILHAQTGRLTYYTHEMGFIGKKELA